MKRNWLLDIFTAIDAGKSLAEIVRIGAGRPLRRRKYDHTPNARFWLYATRGWVKLTLKPGQSVHHWRSWDNGEGYSSEGQTWSHEGDGVLWRYRESGSDCDGRHSSSGSLFAKLDDLAATAAYDAGGTDHLYDGQPIRRAHFEKVGRVVCCDEFAEAMNY